jgi:hypothetical protein
MRRFAVAGLTSFVVAVVWVAGAGATATPGGPVPAHARAASVSFVSARTGFVLAASPCGHAPCTRVLRTTDRGASWSAFPAPRVRVSRPYTKGLWGLRFANANRGWAFGYGLWQTTDGAAHWQRESVPGRFVIDLAPVAGRELVALTATCVTFANGCGGRLSLYHRAISGGRWRRVAMSAAQTDSESVAVHGPVVWVLMGRQLLLSADGGRHFASRRQPCAQTANELPQPTSLSDDGAHTYLLCTGEAALSHTVKHIYRTASTTGGWKEMGEAPRGGDGGVLAAGSDHAVVLATSSAASWLYRSHDSGHHWATARFYGDGGQGWSDLAFVTPTDGAVIHAPAGSLGDMGNYPGKLLLTDNGGRTWREVAF